MYFVEYLTCGRGFGICVTSLEGIFMCDIQIDSRMGAVHQNCSSQTFNVYYANCVSEIVCDLFHICTEFSKIHFTIFTYMPAILILPEFFLFTFKFNIHGTVHRSMTSSNNQQDAT